MTGFGAVGARLYAWFNRHPEANRAVVDVAALRPGDHVLEVGCGPGVGLELAARVVGAERAAAVDPSETFVAMARKRVPGADVRVAGAEDVPFDHATFTAIYTLASMHHWSDRDAGLARLIAVLAPGGRLVLGERLLDKPGHGITPVQIDEVTARLAALGQTGVRTVERRVGRRTLAVIVSERPFQA
ncbi:class I SAM-dependent methyltransferase [Jiangella mangrovi]|uniref:Ubiquinone/menaquinone biosynthesis C-methylase UbiE n=1 Tax=Jiangella mangrovi TaxID=1524084 RepID=A0A7W9GMH7_9ACTN|nr:class I SAM-dependent methyltransferase [Jiangella mangrovi]MBB5786589.1 ubiquinone/menaquinone biosynthesis C-methylase UbiE [Jiangella mangrovi]